MSSCVCALADFVKNALASILVKDQGDNAAGSIPRERQRQPGLADGVACARLQRQRLLGVVGRLREQRALLEGDDEPAARPAFVEADERRQTRAWRRRGRVDGGSAGGEVRELRRER